MSAQSDTAMKGGSIVATHSSNDKVWYGGIEREGDVDVEELDEIIGVARSESDDDIEECWKE